MGAKPRPRRVRYPERFQAKIGKTLITELESLRKTLGLRRNQPAELLRDLTELASWVITQVGDGMQIEARGAGGKRVILRHPALEFAPPIILMDESELLRLAKLLSGAT